MILVPEAINPERVISYAMNNRSSNPVHPAILESILSELLVMPCKIVCPPSSNPAYPAIWVPVAISPGRAIRCTRQNCAYPAIHVPEAINLERAISYAMYNRTPTEQ